MADTFDKTTKLLIDGWALDQAKFGKSFLEEILVRTSNRNEIFGDIKTPISLGLIEGIELKRINGFVNDVDSNDASDVTYQGGIYPFLAAPQLIDIVSDNANDTNGGTGANTVRIFGLVAGYIEDSEDIILNGVTPVQTTKAFIAVNSAFVLTAGTLNANAGTITFTDNAAASIQAQIGVNDNDIGLVSAFQTIQTIPAGKVGLLVHSIASITKRGGSTGVKEGVLSLGVSEFDSNIFYTGRLTTTRSDGTSFVKIDDDFPNVLNEKSSVKASVFSFTNNTRFSVNLTLLLIDKQIFGLQ